MTFELLVAARYLRAKRQQSMISVVTVIAILGVAAGVGALVVAMAMNEGQRIDMRERLLGAQASLRVFGDNGIPDYLALAKKIEQVPGVLAASPHADKGMMIVASPFFPVQVAGILSDLDSRVSRLSQNMIEGDLKNFKDNHIIIGKELREALDLHIGDFVKVLSPTAGAGLSTDDRRSMQLEVVGVFSIGLYDYDKSLVYVPFGTAAHLIGEGPRATDIEVKIDDLDRSEEIGQRIVDKLGPKYQFIDWKTANKTIFGALQMERLGVTIAIGLIIFVASLNIIATLIMLVLEKTRDIAMLMSMGATVTQIRRIFVLQGLIIGSIGTAIGLVLGHSLSFLADKYYWIRLNPEIYTIDHLPFRADPWASVIIAAAAIFISYLATLYPSAAAAKLQPVEALRYE